MLEIARNRGRKADSLAFLAAHPWRTVLRLLPLGIALMLAIDLALGASAEYYNAVHLVEAWAEMFTGGSVSDAPTFIMTQSQLGAPLAMAIGTALLVLEPAVGLAIIVFPVSFVARRVVV